MRITQAAFTLLLFFSCSSNQESLENESYENEDSPVFESVESRKLDTLLVAPDSITISKAGLTQNNCDEYYKNRFPHDSVKERIIDEIIASNIYGLSNNNLSLLKSLKNQEAGFAFKHSINPVFRLKEEELGIIFYPEYGRTEKGLIPISEEISLIENYDPIDNKRFLSMNELKLYPQILDSIYEHKQKPFIYYYTPNKMDSARVNDLGKFYGECMDYYIYSLDDTHISIRDSLLIASSLKLDLTFKKDSKVDSLIKANYNKACLDCPMSDYLFKSFAKLKGVDNLFLVYADTFPINNELDTPSRALVFVNSQQEVIYLWYSEVDLFGCSCL